MIEKYLKKVQTQVLNRQNTKQDLIGWKKKKKEVVNHLNDLEQSRKIIQQAAQTTQSFLSLQISNIVTNALRAVFQEEAYEFKIDFVKRRNSTECDLFFVKEGKNMKPMDSCGYGAADIASLALRIAYWKLEDTRNVIIMDEPTRNLSLNKQPLAVEIIKKLSNDLNLQFIIVTHNSALTEAADKVFITSKKNDSTVITIKEKRQ